MAFNQLVAEKVIEGPTPITPVWALDDGRNRLHVLEIYNTSAQGEGIYQGVPSTFIRLAGCTVGCNWCDTKYSWRSENRKDVQRLKVEEILDWVSSICTHGHIILSGGEPMEHPSLLICDLVGQLLTSDFKVTIETSGIYDPKPVGKLVESLEKTASFLWSVSPKLFSARCNYHHPEMDFWMEESAEGRGIQFKYVINDESDWKEVETLFLESLDRHDQIWQQDISPMIIFQPCTPAMEKNIDKLREQVFLVQEWLQSKVDTSSVFTELARDFGTVVAVRPQMHTLIWGNRRFV